LDGLNKTLTIVDVGSPCDWERGNYCGTYDSEDAVGDEYAEYLLWEQLLSHQKNREKLTRFEK
jgi:hypothetical protein